MSGLLLARHLLPILQECHPDTQIVIGVHHAMANAMCNDDTIMDHACTVVRMVVNNGPGTISISNAIASDDPEGGLVYPDEPQIQEFNIDSSDGLTGMLSQVDQQLQQGTKPIPAS
jgi:hypothetical protein